ncbi:MAG: DNA mismatch repair protein MutS, partial [Phycisphaerales bacterium]
MRQYLEQKKRVGDAILLFRMGDFYETFYDDAVLCSKVLGIVLTSRNKGEDAIPLAGIPYHALDGYLRKLVAAGYHVAISEQLEDAKLAKGVVKRDVVRIVTAGTLTDENLLDERDDNILACICLRGGGAGLAIVELAGGRFEVIDVHPNTLLDELVRLKPAEILVDDERHSEAARMAQELRDLCGTTVTRRLTHETSTYQAEKSLLSHFGVSTLAGFGFDAMSLSLCAAGGIIQYLQETQKSTLDHIASMTRRVSDEYVQIDHSSWRALEIDRTLRGGQREGSLLHAIDRTVHPIGARRLRHWLCAPLRQEDEIIARQDAIAWFVGHDFARGRIRKLLRAMADVERITARVSLARAMPRDMKGLGAALASLPRLITELGDSRVAFLDAVTCDLGGLHEIADLLAKAIAEEPAANLREGGFIADGFDEELDRLRSMSRDAQKWLSEYQKREMDRTGITTLKVGFNRVFGYYIEVTNPFKDRVPADYVRRQTVKNAERYITDELKKFESEVLTAQERANDREYTLFEQVRQQVAARTADLMRMADAVGRLDCVASLAELAVERRYVRPEIVDDGQLIIRDGRHPVLDQVLLDEFVPN